MSPQYDWRLLADTHRPTDPAEIAAEIRRLSATGLKPRDISDTLRLDLAAVLEALRTETGSQPTNRRRFDSPLSRFT